MAGRTGAELVVACGGAAVVRGGGEETRGRCVRTGATDGCSALFVVVTISYADAVTVTVTVAGADVCTAGPERLRDIAKTAAEAMTADAAAIIHGASREGVLRVAVPVIARPESGARPEWKPASAASTFCRFALASRS